MGKVFEELRDIASEEFGVSIKKVKRKTPLTFEELFGVQIKNMDKEQQIEGMQKIIEDMYEKTDAITTTDIINRFVEEGYHKTIWHKVADGDLPVSGQVVRVVLEWLGVMYYAQGVHTEGCGWTFADNPNANASVIAWTGLPEYKE